MTSPVLPWLRTEGEPPNFYDLLDRPLFDPDREELRKAIRSAHRELHLSQNHPDRAIAQRAVRLLAELGRAQSTLDDPARLEAYNAEIVRDLQRDLARERATTQEEWDAAGVHRWLLRKCRVHPACVAQVAKRICPNAEEPFGEVEVVEDEQPAADGDGLREHDGPDTESTRPSVQHSASAGENPAAAGDGDPDRTGETPQPGHRTSRRPGRRRSKPRGFDERRVLRLAWVVGGLLLLLMAALPFWSTIRHGPIAGSPGVEAPSEGKGSSAHKPRDVTRPLRVTVLGDWDHDPGPGALTFAADFLTEHVVRDGAEGMRGHSLTRPYQGLPEEQGNTLIINFNDSQTLSVTFLDEDRITVSSSEAGTTVNYRRRR